MKLRFYDDVYEADKIIKQDNRIIGKDKNNNIVFEFTGISDFSKFILEDGQSFYVDKPTIDELVDAIQNNQKVLNNLTTELQYQIDIQNV